MKGASGTPALPDHRIAVLIAPYYPDPAPALCRSLSLYLDLLLKWNGHTNLTSIREPEAIVERHFGESLFVAQYLPASVTTLLDLGTGAGFPGIPIQLARPDLRVTLAESQNKKVAFLREAVRVLQLTASIWGARVESMPAPTQFDAVTLRAVDDPAAAFEQAERRTTPGGVILHLTTARRDEAIPSNLGSSVEFLVPGRLQSVLKLIRP